MNVQRWVCAAFVVVALVLPGAAPTAGAANRAVSIVSFSFSPATLAVDVGDTVTWTNNDAAAHTVTSDTSVWDSGVIGQAGSFVQTFTQPGIFNYHCTIHSGMRGTIVVGTQVYLPLVIR